MLNLLPQMEDNTQTNPKSREMALHSLESHPGWPIYCQRFSDIVSSQIDAKIFDPKTPALERELLVNARLLLVTNYSPEKMLLSMQAQARTEVIRLENQKK